MSHILIASNLATVNIFKEKKTPMQMFQCQNALTDTTLLILGEKRGEETVTGITAAPQISSVACSWDHLRVGSWIWREDKEIDKGTVGLMLSLPLPQSRICRSGTLSLTSPWSYRDWFLDVWVGVATPFNRNSGFILLSALSICGKTMDYVALWHI